MAEFEPAQSSETTLLLGILAKMNSSLELSELLSTIMYGAKTLMRAEASTLWLYEQETDTLYIHTPAGANNERVKGVRLKRGKGIGWWVFKNREPYLSNDVQNDPLFSGDIVKGGFQTRSLLTVPLINASGEGIGVLQVLNREGGFSREKDIPAFRMLADQAAIAIERERLRDAIRQSEHARYEMELERKEMLRKTQAEQALSFARGVEQERSRIARELHDAILGNLSTIIRGLQPVFQKNQLSNNWIEHLQQLSAEIRVIMDDLKPGVLEHFGLFAALEALLERTCQNAGSPIQLSLQFLSSEPELPDFKKVFIYRVFQEAAANLLKHARASEVLLKAIVKENGNLELLLVDNGDGFELENASSEGFSKGGGHGLVNMRHRISVIGGTLLVDSTPGSGTTLTIQIPLGNNRN